MTERSFKEPKQNSILNKRGIKCYKKEQEMALRELKSDHFYAKNSEKSVSDKINKYVKPQNQCLKYKKRF